MGVVQLDNQSTALNNDSDHGRTRENIPLGNASARCREWQAAIRDCNAVLAKRGNEDANEDDEDADEEDDGVTAPAPPEHDFLMGR